MSCPGAWVLLVSSNKTNLSKKKVPGITVVLCLTQNGVCVVMTDVYVENTGSQGSANRCSASGGARAPQGIHGQLPGCSVFNTPLFFLLFCSVIWFGSVSSTLLAGECRMFGRTRFGNRRSRDMLELVRPCRPSLASTRRTGGKRKEHSARPGTPVRPRPAPPGQGTANGRGYAVRVYGLTGQSGLVFHVDLMPAPGARGAPGEVVPPLCRG